jgi:chromosomal replication initiator protein
MNLNGIWQDFLTIIREEAGSRVVETWFKAVVFSQWDSHAKTAYFKVPNNFVKEWLTNNYMRLFELHLGRLLNEQKIHLLFLDETKMDMQIRPARPQETAEQHMPVLASIKKEHLPVQAAPRKVCINLDYKFDSFVVGPNNSLAYAAAHAVTEKPGILYNPLFIYGGSGLGKTHLLHAIGNQIKAQDNKARVLYQSADRFVTEFINAIRFNKVNQFEQKYREIDVLLIDDIQFISNKEQTQESFFHIFNALYEARKQIVLSSDSMPRDISGLADRLRTRLDGGLITDIQKPTLETKIAILKKKAELQREIISDEIAYFIASRVSSSVRELEGLLIRVLAFANLTHQALSLELAQKVLLSSTRESTLLPVLGFDRIAACVATHYNLTLSELRSIKRHKDITIARNAAMYLMKKLTHKSLAEIALFWGRKDHSTVVHALSKIDQIRVEDVAIQETLNQLERQLLET